MRNSQGKNCGGVFTGNGQTRDGKYPGKGTMAVFDAVEIWRGSRCEWEWQKAVRNAVLLEDWHDTFGPYRSTNPCPGCGTVGSRGWGYNADTLWSRKGTRDTIIDHDGQLREWPHAMPASYPLGFNETDDTWLSSHHPARRSSVGRTRTFAKAAPHDGTSTNGFAGEASPM